MVIVSFPKGDFEICGSVQGKSKPCTSSEFKKIESESKNLSQCKKCDGVKDLGLRAEDEKHRVYHESNEPEHDDISGMNKDEKRWSVKKR